MTPRTSGSQQWWGLEDCVTLGPDLYRRNAFRVLGLSVGASISDAAKTQKLREMQQRLGMSARPSGGAVLPLPASPDADEVKLAREALLDPLTRHVHSFFWFWPTTDRSIVELSSSTPEVTLHEWLQRSFASPKDGILRHNIAVLAHALALDDEAAPPDPARNGSRWANWKLAYAYWRDVLDDPGVWSQARLMREMANDQRLPGDLEDRLQAWLPRAILGSGAKVLVRGAARAAEAGRVSSELAEAAAYLDPRAEPRSPTSTDRDLREHLVLLGASRWSPAQITREIEAELDANKERLEAEASRLSLVKADTPRAELSDATTAVLRHMAVVEALLPSDNAQRTALTDVVAEALLSVAIAHGNKDENWAHWLAFNNEVLKHASGAMLRDRLTTTGTRLQELIKEAADDAPFREAHEALKAGKRIAVTLRSGGFRVPQVCTCCLEPAETTRTYSRSWSEYRVVYSVNGSVSLKFPLCPICDAHARQAFVRSAWIVAIPSVAAVIVGCVVAHVDSTTGGWTAAIVSATGALAAMVALARRVKFAPLDERHACRGTSVEISSAERDRATVTFVNPVYAVAFARTNDFALTKPFEPLGASKYRGTSVLAGRGGFFRIALVILIGMAAGAIAFDSASTTVPRPYTQNRTPNATNSSPRPAVPEPRWQPPAPAPAERDAGLVLLSTEIESGKARLTALEREITEAETTLETLRSEIATKKEEIDGFERRAQLELPVNETLYQAAIDAHNANVDRHNELLATCKRKRSEYERELASVNAKVDDYNRRLRR